MKTGNLFKNLIKAQLLILLLSIVGMINAQTYSYDPPMKTYTDCGSGTESGSKVNYSSCSLAGGSDTYQLGQVCCALWSYSSGTFTIRVKKCDGYFKNGNSGKIIIHDTESNFYCTNFSISNSTTNYVTATVNYGGTVSSSECFFVYLITSDQVYKFSAGAIMVYRCYDISASASPSSGGTVSGAGTYTYNTNCTLSASPNSGYNFVRWKKGSSTVSTNPTYTFKVKSSTAGSYVAEFEANTYTISASASPSNGGSVSGGGTYNQGSTCTLYATPNSGYRFVCWKKGSSQVSTNSTYSFTVNSDASYTAYFEQNSFTITASASPSNGGTVSGAGTYNSGSTCTLTASPNTGYSFVRWKKGSTQVSTSATYSFSVTESASYTAEFQQNSYTISASANPSAGGTVSGAGTYTHGNSCTLTATPNTGYSFVRWTKNGTAVSTSTSYTFTVTESGTYVAQFSQNSYTIGVSASPSNGGSVSGAGTYNHGANCTLTATPNPGYSFVRWTRSGTQVSTSATYSFSVTASASYVAEFQQSSYTVSASANPTAGGTVNGAGSYTHGSTCNLTATANSGYTFTNWTEGSTVVSTSANYSFTVTGNRTLTANFTAAPVNYSITATADPTAGGTVSGAGTYQQGQSCTLTATPATGYTFTNWTKNGTAVSTNASYTFTVTENAAYVANFAAAPVSYHWTVNVNQYPNNATVVGVIQIEGTEQTVNTLEVGAFCGSECRGREKPSLISQLNRYILFMTLYGNDGDELTFRLYDHALNQERDLNCTSTITFATNGTFGEPTNPYVFNFVSAPSYSITATANPTAGGTVTGAGTFNQGQTCTLTATPASGYTFTNWTEGGTVVSSSATYSFTVTGNRTLVANFMNSSSITLHWVPVQNFENTMDGIGVVVIDGVEQQSPALELGIFCGDECRAAVLPENEGGRMVYYFTMGGVDGESFNSRLFDHGTNQELDLYCNATIPFEANGFVGDFDDPYEFIFSNSQVWSLQSGWNWWSTYIEMSNTQGLTMLEQGLGEAGIIIKSISAYARTKADHTWYGSLKSISNEAGYKIQMSAATELVMNGGPANPSNHPITIGNGWNWIGYPVTSQQAVNTAMTGITPTDKDIIKGQSGYARYDAASATWKPSSFKLMPGRAYLYQSNATESKTLVFTQGREELTESPKECYWTNDVYAFPDNASILAVVNVDGEEVCNEMVELGAFVNGECRGSVRLEYDNDYDRCYAWLTVTAADGEEVSFGMYDEATGETNLTSATRITFVADAVVGDFTNPMVVDFSSKQGLLPTLTASPNPVHRNQAFTLQVPDGETVAEMTITDAKGQVVRREQDGTGRASFRGLPVAGVYVIRVTCESGNVYYHKLIVK